MQIESGILTVMAEESTTPDLAARLRLLFAAASRRDLDTLMSFYAPDAVWETTLVTLDGSAAIQERLEEWFGAFDELEFELEEILDLGNGVTFTVVNQRARPAGTSSSGGYIQRQEALIGIWHEGVVTRVTTFLDVDEARAAAERLANEQG
jgi:ketosteroid isomerase-like protein